jgi:hypothetical protein
VRSFNLNAGFVGKEREGFIKRHVFVIHDKGEDISAFIASETVEYLFGGVDHEGRRFFGMKRTQAFVVLACALQIDIFGDQVMYINP